eukprot:gene22000-biopygen17686
MPKCYPPNRRQECCCRRKSCFVKILPGEKRQRTRTGRGPEASVAVSPRGRRPSERRLSVECEDATTASEYIKTRKCVRTQALPNSTQNEKDPGLGRGSRCSSSSKERCVWGGGGPPPQCV